MNHQAHRVIFNKSRGCHMVAGENASGSGGHGCSGVRRSRRNKRQRGQGSTYSAAGAALNAGFSALASSAAVSFVNNGGDLSKTLKDLGSKDSVKNVLLSMATAGALQNMSEVMTIDGQKLSAINAKDSTFTANLGKSLINNMASATMNSALTGAKLEDSFKTALMSAVISAGAGQAASTIGDMTKESPAVKALAHALAGCVAGAAGSGSQGCQSGAIGAVVGG